MSESEKIEKVPVKREASKDKGQKPKMGKFAVGAVIVIMIGTIAVMGYRLMKAPEDGILEDQAKPLSMPSGTSVVVTDDTRNMLSQIEEKVAKGNIAVKMTNGWIFTEGGKQSNAYLANSERNSYDMRFQISLEDTGEVIMISPDVPVGSCIENFPLSVTLEAGTYNVIVEHQLVEDGEVFATVKTAGEIVVN